MKRTLLSFFTLALAALLLSGCVSANTQLERGDTEVLRGNYEAALSYYRKAKRKDPELPGIDEKIRIAEIRVFMQRGDRAVERADWDAARRAYEEVRYRDPQNPELPGRLERLELARAENHFQQGRSLMAENNPFDAITEFEQALEIQPDHPRAAAALEEARAEKRERERRAELAFQDARRAKAEERPEKALELLAQAVQLDPFHRDAARELAELRYALAEGEVQLGDRSADERAWDVALDRYRAAYEYDPRFPGLADRIARAEAELRAIELIAEGDRAFEIGEWETAYSCYDQAWRLTSDRERFQARYQTARTEYADDLLSWAQRAELEGRVEEALDALERLESVDSSYTDVAVARDRLRKRIAAAKTNYAAGCRAQEAFDLFKARDHFLACEQAMPTYRDVTQRLIVVTEGLDQAEQFYQRAQTAERQGDTTRARILYEECLAVCSPYKNARDRLMDLTDQEDQESESP